VEFSPSFTTVVKFPLSIFFAHVPTSVTISAFQVSLTALIVGTGAGAVVVCGVTWGAAVAVGDVVLTGVLDGWVHPATRRMRMSIRSDNPNVKPAVRLMRKEY
jgi:hypothetical protein